ncbi:MAG: hypothetical protein ACQEQC_06125 [Elusimicrobiota bacterium]
MKKILYKTVLIAAVFFAFYSTADAGWWIFGKSEEDVDFEYLYINDIAFDEAGDVLTLYRETLSDGLVYIRGKAKASGTVAAVEISLDNKETWNSAKLSSGRAFEYSFTPEAKEYSLFVKITETTGKTNDIDRSNRKIIISDRSIITGIQKILDDMAGAYIQKNIRDFMTKVSRDFTGGDIVLNRAVSQDFSSFAHLDLKLTVASAVSSSGGKISAAINYSRSAFSILTGENYTDSGTTQMDFKREDSVLKLYSMKHPLIFGLSEADETASGITGIGANTDMLIITPEGELEKLPFEDALNKIEGNDIAETLSEITFVSSKSDADGFIFSTGEKIKAAGLFMDPLGSIDIAYFEGDYLTVNKDVTYQMLPPGTDIETISSVPTSGYGKDSDFDSGDYHRKELDSNIQGRCIAFKLRTGNYAVMEITDYFYDTDTLQGRIIFRYRYQSDGTNLF